MSSAEEVNLSGIYFIDDDRYWTSLWRDSYEHRRRKPKGEGQKAKLSGKRTGDKYISLRGEVLLLLILLSLALLIWLFFICL